MQARTVRGGGSRRGALLFCSVGNLPDVAGHHHSTIRLLPFLQACRFSVQTLEGDDDNRTKDMPGYLKLFRHRAFLERVKKELGLKRQSDWYTVHETEVRSHDKEGVLGEYPSLAMALQTLYPQHPWQPNKFVIDTADPLAEAERKLGIEKAEDWYSVALTDLKEIGVLGKINRQRLFHLLKSRYPQQEWDTVSLLKGRLAQQKQLESAVRNLFPGVEIIRNARRESGLVNPGTGNALELDVYLPSLNLAFEYQEKHHFTNAEYAYFPIEHYLERDRLKREIAQSKGLTLIIIPFWWDKTIDSLVATIRKHRPELLKNVNIRADASSISEEPPEDAKRSLSAASIEGIGQPSNACFFTQSNIDPSKWWIFEKYDGVRGFWNPEKKAFYSRYGRQFHFPDEIINSMPTNIFLDGELWFGRESFSEALKLASRTASTNIDWSKFKYMVFDIPNAPGPYEERYKKLEEYIGEKEWKYVNIAPKEECRDTEHLETFFQDVIDSGGEGIILRDPKTVYEPGRSQGYLKHKKFRDAEARIIGLVAPQQWECELPNGVKFIAAPVTTEFEKRWKPKEGDIVSFKHHGFLAATQKPKLATLYRIRTDISWTDVVNNWENGKVSTSEALSPVKARQRRKIANPKGYWWSLENRRKFLLSLAEESGFDPTVAANWHNITPKIWEKKAGALLKQYGGIARVLTVTFPGMDFKAHMRPKGYWKDIENRRKYFTQLAAELGFDPSSAEGWRSVTNAQLLAHQGGGLLRRYKTLSAALQDTFPNLQLEGIFSPPRRAPGKEVDASAWPKLLVA